MKLHFEEDDPYDGTSAMVKEAVFGLEQGEITVDTYAVADTSGVPMKDAFDFAIELKPTADSVGAKSAQGAQGHSSYSVVVRPSIRAKGKVCGTHVDFGVRVAAGVATDQTGNANAASQVVYVRWSPGVKTLPLCASPPPPPSPPPC